MNNLVTYILITLTIGITIGIQGVLTSITAGTVGALNTGAVASIFNGLSGLFILIVFNKQLNLSSIDFTSSKSTVIYLFLIGLFGVFIVAGISYTFPHIGLLAGTSILITGQMLVSVINDTFGFSGFQAPLTPQRIVGLVLLAVAVYLILPKNIA